jgi:hypothetical protein
MTALTVAGAALPARAQNQSLADVARKEEQRRQQVKEPAKVITNKDLGDVPPAVAPPADGKAASSDQAKSDGKDQDKNKTGEPAKDQAYWAGRKKDLQTQLDRDQTFADALQTKINSLTADFTARDDPAQRAVIARDRQKALAELDRLQKAVQDDKKALADLDDEARRAGVPPGWLR